MFSYKKLVSNPNICFVKFGNKEAEVHDIYDNYDKCEWYMSLVKCNSNRLCRVVCIFDKGLMKKVTFPVCFYDVRRDVDHKTTTDTF